MSSPLFLVRGAPTPEELAAVVAVLVARAVGGLATPEPPRRSRWATPVPRTHGPAGPGAWQACALPR